MQSRMVCSKNSQRYISPGRMSFIPRMAWTVLAMLDGCRLLRIFHLNIVIDDSAKFSRDIVALQRDGFAAVHVNRCYRPLTRTRKTDADIGVLAFAGAVDHASHHRESHILHAVIFFAPYQHLVANISL